MDLDRCYYCDEVADSIDHVVPRAILSAIRDSGDDELIAIMTDRHRRMTVASCRECNSLAGVIYDQTLVERRHRIARKFARRYRRAIEMPDWSDTELMGLSDMLRRYVIASLVEREIAQRRLRNLRR